MLLDQSMPSYDGFLRCRRLLSPSVGVVLRAQLGTIAATADRG